MSLRDVDENVAKERMLLTEQLENMQKERGDYGERMKALDEVIDQMRIELAALERVSAILQDPNNKNTSLPVPGIFPVVPHIPGVTPGVTPGFMHHTQAQQTEGYRG